MTVKARWSLLAVIVAALPSHAEEALFAAVPSGLEYHHRRIGAVPWAIDVLKVDRSRPEFRFASSLANGKVLGRGTVTAQVAAWPVERGRPVAAVNADFFAMGGPYAGDPSGMQILGGELVSVGAAPAFWIDREGKPQIGSIASNCRAEWPDGTETPFGLNGPRKDDGVVLFTPTFGDSTRTESGRELVLERDGESAWLPVRAGQSFSARVREVRDAGDTTLSPDLLVLSLGPALRANLPAVQPGAVVKLSLRTDPDLTGVDVAIGGGPVLLHEGKAPDWGTEPAPRHPRTLLGWNDSHYFLIVVDGRRKDFSAGMTFAELSQLALDLGCTECLNLDGGGSSTLWLGGKVMNLPSDGTERPVANALLLLDTAATAAETPGTEQPAAAQSTP